MNFKKSHSRRQLIRRAKQYGSRRLEFVNRKIKKLLFIKMKNEQRNWELPF